MDPVTVIEDNEDDIQGHKVVFQAEKQQPSAQSFCVIEFDVVSLCVMAVVV